MSNHIEVSALGFGCASVMGKVGKSQSISAMAQAYDLGVTHFDVARSYGFGRAESVLGKFINGKRSNVTVTTKFGVIPPHLTLKTKILIPIARKVSEYVPRLKAKLRSKASVLLAEKRFDVDYAQSCLEISLQELNTDYIDFYMLHEPELELLQNSDELKKFLEANVDSGKVRAWGIAYKAPEDYSTIKILGGDVIQFEGNVGNLEAVEDVRTLDFRQRFVMRPFAGGLSRGLLDGFLSKNHATSEVLQELNISLEEFSLCVASELAGSIGSVVCSMFSSQHITANVNTINKLWQKDEVKRLVRAYINENNDLNAF